MWPFQLLDKECELLSSTTDSCLYVTFQLLIATLSHSGSQNHLFTSSGYDCLHPYHLEAKSNALGRLSYQDLCNSWLPQSHSLVPSAFYFSMCLGEHICSQKLFCALDWKISHKHHEINMAPTFSQWPYSIYLALSATALFDYLKLSAGMIQWLEAQDHLLCLQ